MPFRSLSQCSTKVIRQHFNRMFTDQNPKPLTRSQMIEYLTREGQYCIEYEDEDNDNRDNQDNVPQPPNGAKAEREGPLGRRSPERGTRNGPLAAESISGGGDGLSFYAPMSPYIPVASARRHGHLLTDAAFSRLNVRDIRSVASLQVGNVDVVQELHDIRDLKAVLVEDYIALRNELEFVKGSVERTLNHDLYMYSVPHDVAWVDVDITQPHHEQVPTFDVLTKRFTGKLEDTTLHGNLVLELDRRAAAQTSELRVSLPIPADERSSVYPIQVLMRSVYDATSETYLSESTSCHAYVTASSSILTIFLPLLVEPLDLAQLSASASRRLRLDVTLRYFVRLDPLMLSPPRLSSMWYQESVFSERGHRVTHHWTVLDDRVELFTTVRVRTELMQDTDEMTVPLPVPCSADQGVDSVGYGVVHYRMADEPNVIYSNNSSLIRIGRQDRFDLFVKSALLLNVNQYYDMVLAAHVIYTKETRPNRDGVHDLRVSRHMVRRAIDPVQVSFRTIEPINPMYITGLRAVTVTVTVENGDGGGVDGVGFDPVSHLNGHHQKWSFDAVMPLVGVFAFEVNLLGQAFRPTNTENVVLVVDDDVPVYESIHLTLDYVHAQDLALWIDGFVPVPAFRSRHVVDLLSLTVGVRVTDTNTDTLVQETPVLRTGLTHTDRQWVQITNLDPDTEYRVDLLLTDEASRTFEVSRTLRTNALVDADAEL